jgi:hypothetical protein
MFSYWIVVFVVTVIVIALGFMTVGVPYASSLAHHKGKRNTKAKSKKPTKKQSRKTLKKAKAKQPGSKSAQGASKKSRNSKLQVSF